MSPENRRSGKPLDDPGEKNERVHGFLLLNLECNRYQRPTCSNPHLHCPFALELHRPPSPLELLDRPAAVLSSPGGRTARALGVGRRSSM